MEGVALPEGLADMPPGPGLAAALAGLDPARVANRDLLVMLRAQARQAAHDQARLLAVIAEVTRAEPVRDDREIRRAEHPADFSSDEVRAALAWSRRAADSECDFAEQVVHELPQVHHAFLGGRLDRPKVRVFTSHLHGLTATQIAKICAVIVPVAHRLTPGQIAARLMRMIIAIDPRHYERRYRKALRDRWVTAYLDENGVAVLTTHGLRPAQAAAALERIDALARAARTAGHRSTLDQIRVDIVAGLLDGTLHNLDRAGLIARLIAHRSTNDDPPPADQTPGDAGTADPSTADGADPSTADPSGADPRSTDPSASDRGIADRARSGAGSVGSDAAGSCSSGSDANSDANSDAVNDDVAPRTADICAEGSRAGDHDDPHSARSIQDTPSSQSSHGQHGQRVGVEIRVALSTLLGRDDHPGEIPGMGPVAPSHARDITAEQRRAEWRFAIVDESGRLIVDGITSRRPADIHRAGPPGGIVELHIATTLLAQLAAELSEPATPSSTTPAPTTSGTTAPRASTAGPWDGVIADIARQYADRDTRDLDKHPGDRLPRTALRRHTQIRDRTCVGPGCRHRPARCDQDHTIAHKDGGETVAAGLAPTCRHDHRLKHDGGWQLAQPEPGAFVWTSPLGGVYEVRPEPIEPPLPDPDPIPDDPWHDQPAHEDGIPFRLHEPARPPPSPPAPQRQVIDLDEPPPF